jgi:short-subunit dehydrogenase
MIVPGERKSSLAKKFGPWAVVTGASDGMGRFIAKELALEGLNLVLVARRADVLAELATSLKRSAGVETMVLPLDLGRPEQVELLIERTLDKDVGLLVTAAGFGTSGRFVENELAVELDMLGVNCRAVLVLTHAFARLFKARGRGGLVLFGSLVGWQGVAFAAHYAATKAYVQSLAEGLRVELAPHNVTVLSAAPGPVSSGFAERASMVMSAATPAAVAAKGIVRALGRKGTVVPGALGKLLTYSLIPLPRSLRVRIMTQVMRGMTKQDGRATQDQAQPA